MLRFLQIKVEVEQGSPQGQIAALVIEESPSRRGFIAKYPPRRRKSKACFVIL